MERRPCSIVHRIANACVIVTLFIHVIASYRSSRVTVVVAAAPVAHVFYHRDVGDIPYGINLPIFAVSETTTTTMGLSVETNWQVEREPDTKNEISNIDRYIHCFKFVLSLS